MTACIARDRAQSFALRDITHIVRERPCPVERGGPEIFGFPRDDVARAVAHATADAFDRFIDEHALSRLGFHAREVVAALALAFELALCLRPLVEESRHVRDEILHDRQIVQRSDFEAVVLKSEKPVLVDFWAAWCGPCRMIAPIVEQIHGELGDKVTVMKMDIDENPATPNRLGIMSIPTVIIFKDGKAAERTVGYRPNMKGDLKAKLEALI